MGTAAGRQVVEDLQELLPGFRERADEAERLRVVPEQSVKELEEVGVFKMLQPKRWGGLEAHPVEFFTAIRDIAGACGSTAWISSVVAVHPWQIALFPNEAQEAIWGEDPTVRASSSYAPTGKAVKTEGGYKLSGKWAFSSGSDHCDWVLLGSLVFDEDGNWLDFKTFLLNRKDYVINDVWHTVGLRGTGSNDIVVEEVFVPEAFTLSMSETGRCYGPGQAENTANLYKLPFHSVFTSAIATPIIGMAYGVYQEHVDMQKARVRAAYGEKTSKSDPYAPVRIAKASSEIDAAWGLLMNNIREEWELVEAGEEIPLRLRLKVRRDQVLGSQRAVDAIDSMFEATGGRALAEGSYMQRAWRDAHSGKVHAANDVERALAMFGNFEFGNKIEPGMY